MRAVRHEGATSAHFLYRAFAPGERPSCLTNRVLVNSGGFALRGEAGWPVPVP